MPTMVHHTLRILSNSEASSNFDSLAHTVFKVESSFRLSGQISYFDSVKLEYKFISKQSNGDAATSAPIDLSSLISRATAWPTQVPDMYRMFQRTLSLTMRQVGRLDRFRMRHSMYCRGLFAAMNSVSQTYQHTMCRDLTISISSHRPARQAL